MKIIRSWNTTEILIAANGLLISLGRKGRITPATISRNRKMQPNRPNATPGRASLNGAFNGSINIVGLNIFA
jgi:hypothetical protein